jgi:hypothetical protein
MLRVFYIILVSLLFTSCASILKKEYELSIHSNKANTEVEVLDSIYQLPAKVKVKRAKKDLHVTLRDSSFSKKYIIKPSPNGQFLYNNLAWVYFAPLGYAIDFTNQKRFDYGRSVYIDTNNNDSIIRVGAARATHHIFKKGLPNYFSKRFPYNKGRLNLVFSLPYFSGFYLHPHNETSKTSSGFMGISTGLDYAYKNNRFLALRAAGMMDYPFLFPISLNYSGEVQKKNAVNLSITDNFIIGRFTLGYGLNYSKHSWELKYYDYRNSPPPTRDSVKKTTQALGITLNAYHQIWKLFNFGITYHSSIYSICPEPSFNYEHIISLDFAVKIGFNK